MYTLPCMKITSAFGFGAAFCADMSVVMAMRSSTAVRFIILLLPTMPAL